MDNLLYMVKKLADGSGLIAAIDEIFAEKKKGKKFGHVKKK